MGLVNNFKVMALYNQRVNHSLLACCETLPVDVLHKETQSFFPTIVSYWNHLLFGDLILLGRLAALNLTDLSPETLKTFPEPFSPQDQYFSELSEIKVVREALDNVIIKFCDSLTEQTCQKIVRYTTTEGDEVTKVIGDVVQHIFNHQTHHRGQLTCVLSQFGVDYGCMDLPVIVPNGSHSF